MDTFKTRPGSSEELLITEENFTNKTKKQFPYVMKENGKNVYKAICPACDNPIRIVGLYKREEDVKRKPYGRHTPSDLPGLTVYNEEDYLNCPYPNPNQSNDGAKRRPGDKKSSWIYDLMKEHFDLIISILEKSLHIYISYYFAETLLQNWKNNEGWRYYHTNYNNLSYMLLYAEKSYRIFGQLIRKDSNVEKAILEKGKNFQLEDIGMNYYHKIKQKDGFLDAVFYLTNHQLKRDGEHTEEIYKYCIIEGEKEIYKEKIIVEKGRLYKLIQQQQSRSNREERLIEIANRVL